MSVDDQPVNFQGNFNIVFLFVIAQSIGLILALITGAIWIKKTDNAVSPEIIEQRKKDGQAAHYLTEDTPFKEWAIHVFWFGLMAFAMSVFTRIDTSMIHSLSPEILGNTSLLNDGDFQAGLYAKSYRLLDAALIFSGLLSTQLLPMFTQKIATREGVHSVLKLGVLVVLSVSLCTALVAYLFGNQILHLLYPNSPQTMYSQLNNQLIPVGHILPFTFKLLMTAFIPMSLIHVFGTFVTALGQLKWLSFLALICVGINIAINGIFIPKYGAMGASVGCFITQSVFAIACIVKTINYLKHNG
jgi:O-antigen/teichoic acid export membrane protein